MPIENFEEQGLPRNPDLRLAETLFLLKTSKYENDKTLIAKLMDAIRTDNMAPFYELVCKQLHLPLDQNFLTTMKQENQNRLKEIDDAIVDAQEHLGEIEIRDALMKKAEYLSKIGDKEGFLNQIQKVSASKGVTLGYKFDLTFHQLRMGFFFRDMDLIRRMLDKAQSLMDEGGDWDRRNRLQVYRGVYCMLARDFAGAASNFLDSVATFTSYELMDYPCFVGYTVLCAMIALPRTKLREKVIKGAEVREVLHSLPLIKEFLFSLYECRYADFFHALAKVEQEMKFDWLFSSHYQYFVKEMRIMAYAQLLQSYQSLTIDYMAKAFGVTPDFIDSQLSRFIAAGRLYCKIDKVNNIVETTRPDNKNFFYQNTIKQGDALLNRIQKLSRVINL